MDLDGKVALVMGGTRIGQGVAEELAKKGCHLILTYRSSRKAAEETANQVRSLGREGSIIQADLTMERCVKRVMAKIQKEYGRLDILVNLVSIYFSTPWDRLTLSIWDKNLRANLTVAYLAVLQAAPLMQEKGGRVIHFSDWLALSGRPRYKGYAPYHAAKSGLVGLAQAQALELAPKILVNVIAPGPILPPPDITKKQLAEVKKVTPLGRWGGALEIAKAVLFFAETDFVTGECLRVDGGRHLY